MKKTLEPPPIAGPARNEPRSAELSDDAFLGGRLMLLQPRHGYRAGIDAVLLAAAIEVTDVATANLLDLGAGVGTVGLCAARRIGTLRVTLMEREPELCAIAAENIERNGLEARVRCVRAAVGTPSSQLAAAGLVDESFTHVVTNPPFMAPGTGTNSQSRLKAASHGLQDGQSLDDWARFAARMLRPEGSLILIHKADALFEVLSSLERRFGATTVLPLHPRPGEPANRVIIKAIKGRRSRLTLMPGLTLHGDGNSFTPHLESVLRHAAPLETAQ